MRFAYLRGFLSCDLEMWIMFRIFEVPNIQNLEQCKLQKIARLDHRIASVGRPRPATLLPALQVLSVWPCSMIAIFLIMPNTQVKEAAKVLLECHTIEHLISKLIALRAKLICADHYDQEDDIFIMDLCAYFLQFAEQAEAQTDCLTIETPSYEVQ